jgi:hypothetical protein
MAVSPLSVKLDQNLSCIYQIYLHTADATEVNKGAKQGFFFVFKAQNFVIN